MRLRDSRVAATSAHVKHPPRKSHTQQLSTPSTTASFLCYCILRKIAQLLVVGLPDPHIVIGEVAAVGGISHGGRYLYSPQLSCLIPPVVVEVLP